MRRTLVGVMGPGEGATGDTRRDAYELGRAIATAGWVLVSGGRGEGVMHEASRGASEAGGLTVGILPTATAEGMSDFVDIPIITGLGQGRNNVNALSSEVVFVCGMSAGTASEVCLALRAARPVILLRPSEAALRFFETLTPAIYRASNPAEAIQMASQILTESPRQV